jgi:hypothetical protein
MNGTYVDTIPKQAVEVFSQPQSRIPEPTILVIFGASGDLTKRKLLPALFHLEQSGLLPECVFHGFLPPNPQEGCHPVHGKAATQSTGRLPPSPRQSCHRIQVTSAIIGAPRRRVVYAYATGTLLVNLLSSCVVRDSPVSWAAWR